jgi:glycosyltransferase involved in cell wall biosynthesis
MIELSFCIPTYNREKSVYRLVTDILTSTDKNIEVVVLDNGSSDNTLALLGEIKDKRLSIYSNGENKGALFNMVNVLNKGKGKFLVYSTDQDYINVDLIPEFKKMLSEQDNLAGGYCLFTTKSYRGLQFYPKGYEAVSKLGYLSRHPTGYFFNRKLIQDTLFIERFSDPTVVGLFPLEFVFAEICQQGDGVIYGKPLFTPEKGTNVEINKSSTTDGSIEKAFFSPQSRLNMAVNYTRHIESLELSDYDKKKLMMDVFVRGLAAATFGYKSIINNKRLCIHYYMKHRSIGFRELYRISKYFYSKFRDETFEFNAGINNSMIFFIFFFNRFLYYVYDRLKC